MRHNRYTSNGVFICASLMAGLRIWAYRDSIHPDLSIGKPWAVAGLQLADYSHPEDQRMAKFWRWAVQQDIRDPVMEDFVSDTVDLLYDGADLKRLQDQIARGSFQAQETYNRLRHMFGFYLSELRTASRRLGFMDGQIEVPDDFNSMGQAEIEKMFGVA